MHRTNSRRNDCNIAIKWNWRNYGSSVKEIDIALVTRPTINDALKQHKKYLFRNPSNLNNFYLGYYIYMHNLSTWPNSIFKRNPNKQWNLAVSLMKTWNCIWWVVLWHYLNMVTKEVGETSFYNPEQVDWP